MPALITCWTQDVTALSPAADPEAVAAAGAELMRRWAQEHRRYHTTRHLAEVFWALEDLTDAGEITSAEATIGRVAGWFHDAEYVPLAGPGANEAGSAELAATLLSGLGLRAALVDEVVSLIRMTAGHALTDDSALQRAFHDADLWILSAPAERFDEYCAQVRQEYAAVPDDAYRIGRSAMLDGLAGFAEIYATGFGHGHWEQPARANVARELARLA